MRGVERIILELTTGVEEYLTKTFIGCIEADFGLSGYHFSPRGLNLVPKTIVRFQMRITRLYEQGADKVHARRWWRWPNASSVAFTDVKKRLPALKPQSRMAT